MLLKYNDIACNVATVCPEYGFEFESRKLSH